MIPLADFAGKTLFMAAASPAAVLVTRTGNRMRKRSMKFLGEHAALDWCLARRATFVLLPAGSDSGLS